MKQPILSDIRDQTRTPSLRFVCSVAHLLQSDPADMLHELGYSHPEITPDARGDEQSLPPAQAADSEFSEYYLG